MTADRNQPNLAYNYIIAKRNGDGSGTKVDVSIISHNALPYALSDGTGFNNSACVSLESIFAPISSISGGVFPSVELAEYDVDDFGYGIIPTTGLNNPPSHQDIIDRVGDYKRFVGLKMPIYAVGRGISTSGTIVGGENKDDVMNWKAGPIDLRWDDTRKVWCGSNTFDENTICGYLTTSITAASDRYTPSTFNIETMVKDTTFKAGPSATIYNFDTNFSLNLSPSDDVFVVAIKKMDVYIAVYIGCP